MRSSLASFDKARPRYLLVAEELFRAIEAGTYPVGSLLPGEGELCEQFAVSRHTIREAIRQLKELGLVSRHQGIGTRIESRQTFRRFVLSAGSIPDLWQYVETTPLNVLRTSIVSATTASVPLPAIGDPEEWMLIEGVRYPANSRMPLSYSRIHVNGLFRSLPLERLQSSIPVYSLLEELSGEKVVAIRQEITSIAADKIAARLLKVKAGAPVLQMRRVYSTNRGTVLQVGVSITPGDRFTYEMEIAT